MGAHPRELARWRKCVAIAGTGALASMLLAGAVPALAQDLEGVECPVYEPTEAEVGGELNLFEWEGYHGEGVPEFEQWYEDEGITPDVRFITNENLVTFLSTPAGDGTDVTSFNQGDVPNAYLQGVASPIFVEEVPSLANMYEFFKEGDFWKICDGVYAAVPWSFGPIAVVTRTDEVPSGSIVSYEDLLKPEYTGKIGAYDSSLNMISTAAIATGHDPAKLTREELNGPVRDWLTALQPQLKALATSVGDQANLLISGDTPIMLVGWAFFLPTLAAEGIDAELVVPEEGAFGFIDSIVIPPDAPNRANALAWVNAMMEGDTSRGINEYTFQLSANPDVNAEVSEDITGFFPEDINSYVSDTLKWNRSWFDPDGPYATAEEWDQLWTEIKAGV